MWYSVFIRYYFLGLYSMQVSGLTFQQIKALVIASIQKHLCTCVPGCVPGCQRHIIWGYIIWDKNVFSVGRIFLTIQFRDKSTQAIEMTVLFRKNKKPSSTRIHFHQSSELDSPGYLCNQWKAPLDGREAKASESEPNCKDFTSFQLPGVHRWQVCLEGKGRRSHWGLQELLDLRNKPELLLGRGFSGPGLVLPCSSTSEDL